MNNISLKTRTRLAGAFILIAYGVIISAFTENKIVVMLADVISGLAVIGIAVLMYPLFKDTNEQFTKWYLGLKFVEGASMIIAGLLFLSTPFQYTHDLIY